MQVARLRSGLGSRSAGGRQVGREGGRGSGALAALAPLRGSGPTEQGWRGRRLSTGSCAPWVLTGPRGMTGSPGPLSVWALVGALRAAKPQGRQGLSGGHSEQSSAGVQGARGRLNEEQGPGEREGGENGGENGNSDRGV